MGCFGRLYGEWDEGPRYESVIERFFEGVVL